MLLTIMKNEGIMLMNSLKFLWLAEFVQTFQKIAKFTKLKTSMKIAQSVIVTLNKFGNVTKLNLNANPILKSKIFYQQLL